MRIIRLLLLLSLVASIACKQGSTTTDTATSTTATATATATTTAAVTNTTTVPATTTTAAPTPPPPAPVSTRVKIASNLSVGAGGCEDRAQTFTVTAPGRLDLSKGGQGGAPAGFDVDERGNGSHGARDISSSGNTLHLTLHAEGGGSKQNIPLKGEICAGATGANSAADVFAYVFQ